MFQLLIVFFCLLPGLAESTLSAIAQYYLPNRHITPDVWDQVEPYLLPPNHPIKKNLDLLFSKSRITSDEASILNAGFEYPSQHGSNVQAVKHPLLKGYFIKMYCDIDGYHDEWRKLLWRIDGANQLREGIEALGYQKLMKVPRKWIYPLPEEPSPAPHQLEHRRNFILIAEDMETVGRRRNFQYWKSKPTIRLLRALSVIVTEFGLKDSCHIDNIPWCKDRKIAFVDTEKHHSWPVRYQQLNECLSEQKSSCWKKLYKKLIAASPAD